MSLSLLKTIFIPVLLTLVAFFLAYQFVDPAPPKEIVFTTGIEGGAYDRFARQYQQILATHGVTLVLKNSQGSIDNILRLKDGDALVGFVQGGTAGEEKDESLLTLGSLYYEPLWVFHRKTDIIATLPELAGKRLVVGAQGSGTRALVLRLLKDNKLLDSVDFDDDTANALQRLKASQVDAVFMVASAASPVIRRFLEDESIELMSFDRAEAYQRRMKFLTHVVLPEGMVDLAKDIPSDDRVLLASTANLVINSDLHPAIQDLLLQAAEEVHGKGGWFEKNGEFPNADFAEFAVSKEANRFFKYGPPFLQRYLPFRLASLIDRLKVMILPLVVLMIPLMKIMPPIYRWRMRSKIYRWYQELERIDLDQSRPDPDIAALKLKLEKIDQEVIHVSVPLSFASQLYDLRQHIELVKRRLSQ